jgi:hypothetical protein
MQEEVQEEAEAEASNTAGGGQTTPLAGAYCEVLATASDDDDGGETRTWSKVDVTCCWRVGSVGKLSDSVRQLLRRCGHPVVGDVMGSHLQRQVCHQTPSGLDR